MKQVLEDIGVGLQSLASIVFYGALEVLLGLVVIFTFVGLAVISSMAVVWTLLGLICLLFCARTVGAYKRKRKEWGYHG